MMVSLLGLFLCVLFNNSKSFNGNSHLLIYSDVNRGSCMAL